MARVLRESLRATREARGLSRREASEKTGTPERQIEAWETGEREPGFVVVAVYLRRLGVLTMHDTEPGPPRRNDTQRGRVNPAPSLDEYESH